MEYKNTSTDQIQSINSGIVHTTPNDNLAFETNLEQRLVKSEKLEKEILLNEQNKDSSKPQVKARLECLDIYRGLTMVGMILVDNMGNSSVIWPLNETEWNGLSTADCVFPSFLFISGVAITLSIKQNGDKKQQFIRILERFLKLFIIGVALNVAIANYEHQFRIMGVLQRIALCYLVTSVSYLFIQKFIILFILNGFFILIYVYFMYFFDVPGCGANNVTPTCNFGNYLDEKIFTYNYMMAPNDPEGLFTTFGAFVTTFIGLCFGLALAEFKNQKKKLSFVWLFMSCILIFLGVVCNILSTTNKKIWNPSFVFIVSGMSGGFLNLCFVVVDIYNNLKLNKGLQWMKWLGLNPLFVFVTMMWLEIVMFDNIKFQFKDQDFSFWEFVSKYVFQSWLRNTYVSSLAVTLTHLGIWVGVTYYLFKRQIFIKL